MALDSVSDLHRRLDELEDEIRRARTGRTLPQEHHREAEAIHARARALRDRSSAAYGSKWEEAKHTLYEDWQSLMESATRWIESVDQSFDRR